MVDESEHRNGKIEATAGFDNSQGLFAMEHDEQFLQDYHQKVLSDTYSMYNYNSLYSNESKRHRMMMMSEKDKKLVEKKEKRNGK